MPRFLSSAALLALVFLTGCSWFGGGDDHPTAGGGLVVGDEPYAVQAGVSVLREGGSAVDAATTIYFALAATYPVAAGIGGGGICLVRDPNRGRTDEFAFLPRAAAGGGAYAVPGAVRGFALMQATYGHLPWQRDVAPGEGFAATGFPISRALASRIEASQDVIRLDVTLSAEFLTEAGTAKAAGAMASNPALGTTLSAIRREGPDAFYRGGVAQKIVAYSASQGGAITDAELSNYTPQRDSAALLNIGDVTVALPSADLGAGKFAQLLLSPISQSSGDLGAETTAATKAALEQFNIQALPKDMGSTGFAATDDSGQSVACAVTMNGPFGSGHTAQGTGVTLANAPSTPLGISGAFLTPLIATNSDGSLALVGSGVGGPNGSAAIAYAFGRMAHGADVTQTTEAHSTGLAPYETVNLIACPAGICSTVADPGANGLGLSSGR